MLLKARVDLPFYVALVYGLMTIMDAITTWTAIVFFSAVELNPNTNTDSIYSFSKQEFFQFLIVMLVSTVTYYPCKTRLLRALKQGNYNSTMSTYKTSICGVAWAIQLCIFAIAVGRLLPITSNLAFMLFGQSPLQFIIISLNGLIGVSPFTGLAIVYIFCFMFLLKPSSRHLFLYLSMIHSNYNYPSEISAEAKRG